MKKLFVGSLSWNTSDAELEAAFSRFGDITEAKVITNRETGRSRGFGFVTFKNDDAASVAMSEMNGAELDGRSITVNEAKEKRRDNNRGGSGGGRRRDRM
jgi:RNA recognition motif-containing protein